MIALVGWLVWLRWKGMKGGWMRVKFLCNVNGKV